MDEVISSQKRASTLFLIGVWWELCGACGIAVGVESALMMGTTKSRGMPGLLRLLPQPLRDPRRGLRRLPRHRHPEMRRLQQTHMMRTRVSTAM
jgi:hypothetical protein